MKQRLTGILLLCWLIPFSVMFGVMVVYTAFNHGGDTAENFRRQAEFNNVICMERLNAAVEASRQASYDKELVVENAIEHGVVPNKKGTVLIKGYRDEAYLYLETRNDGGLTKEDKEKIDRLLSADYNREEDKSGNLGIANVNQRLRIFFGEPCGLTISESKDGSVTARLTLPFST